MQQDFSNISPIPENYKIWKPINHPPETSRMRVQLPHFRVHGVGPWLDFKEKFLPSAKHIVISCDGEIGVN